MMRGKDIFFLCGIIITVAMIVLIFRNGTNDPLAPGSLPLNDGRQTLPRHPNKTLSQFQKRPCLSSHSRQRLRLPTL